MEIENSSPLELGKLLRLEMERIKTLMTTMILWLACSRWVIIEHDLTRMTFWNKSENPE